jgi:hypothetical protein
MAADVRIGPTFESGAARALFDIPGVVDLDCFPDGQRFVVVRALEGQKPLGLTLVTGWAAELTK